MSDLLNGTELAAQLGISLVTLWRRKKAGALRKFETSQPDGQRRYSRALVDAYVQGESIVRIGRGARR